MLTIKEAVHKGDVVSVFSVSLDHGAVEDALSLVKTKMKELFRCGEAPREGRSPLLGKIAFVKTEDAVLDPAMAAALTSELMGVFDVICIQQRPGQYLASVVSTTCDRGYKLGQRIAMADVKEHKDPWSTIENEAA